MGLSVYFGTSCNVWCCLAIYFEVNLILYFENSGQVIVYLRYFDILIHDWVCFEAKWHFFLFLVSFEIFPHTVRSTPRSLTPFVSSNFSNMMKHFTLTERDRTAASHHEEIINHSCIIQVWIRVVFTSFCYILLDIQNDHTSLYVTT
jgi:hypothetical protein